MTPALRYGATLAVLALFSTGHQSIAQTLSAAAPSPAPNSIKLSAFALSQIAALRTEKAALTPIQQKIESNLFRAALLTRPIAQANALQTGPLSATTLSLLKTVHISQNAQPDAHGMVLVDIKGTVSSALLAKIQSAGGVVQGSWPAFGAVRASVPVTQLETIAASPAVLSVRPAAHGHVLRNRLAPLPGQASADQPFVPGLPVLTEATAAEAPAKTKAAREASVKSHLPALLAHVRAEQAARPGSSALSLAAFGGIVNNADPEGDLAQRAALARQKFGVNGAGIKIGVLSDSVDGLAGEQRLNRLGPVTVLPGQSGVPGTGEGTAMLEIVHRIAPGAQLYFATAYDTPENFASNILALQQAGCNVIVDDVAYFDEPPFQDGVIAQAVDTVSAAGAYYFSSAGNNYNVDQFFSTANWEGNFVDAGTFSADEAGLLAFDSNGDDTNQVLTSSQAPQQTAFLFWADPQSTATSGATDDYDLFVLAPNSDTPPAYTVAYSSTDPHTGQPGQDPIQACEADQNDLIVVSKNHGNVVDLHLDVTSDGAAVLNIATPGGTFGHAASAKCYGTAAADASVPYGQGRAFNLSDVTEYFSSDGPRRIIFNPDGSEITPGDRTSSGGTLRQAPVLTSSDGISDFFNPFYGTSAAAPHAAAITALVLSADPALKNQPTTMFNLLTGACIPFDGSFEAATPNRDSGYGLLDAYNAVQASAARGGK
jgi:hypothetical protein